MKTITDRLVKEVEEYYSWHKNRNVHVKRFITNRDGTEMLLVRFIDEQNEKLSSLMFVQNWTDGHSDVTEMYVCYRECEKAMIKAYEGTGFGVEMDDDYL